ncbi:hypothetical protein ACJMK2_017392 [Sinanodonta woodiana]|uniref:Uncharacterized protein n=1 Tax=Sinanodonta woodiana TaxID=1069815 RepID=A0ABD3UAK7_SINWO
MQDMSDRQEEKKKMDQNKQCKAKPEQKAVKKGDEIHDNVKGVVAASTKRPQMNDPTALRTESDDEDMDPIEGWKPPSKEEEEKARRGK